MICQIYRNCRPRIWHTLCVLAAAAFIVGCELERARSYGDVSALETLRMQLIDELSAGTPYWRKVVEMRLGRIRGIENDELALPAITGVGFLEGDAEQGGTVMIYWVSRDHIVDSIRLSDGGQDVEMPVPEVYLKENASEGLEKRVSYTITGTSDAARLLDDRSEAWRMHLLSGGEIVATAGSNTVVDPGKDGAGTEKKL